MTKSNRNIKIVDVVFVLDATSSTQSVFKAMTNKVEDLSFELSIQFPRASIHFGAVIYRDPVDYRPLPIGTVDEDGFKDPDINEEDEKKYDTVKYPEDKNIVIDIVDDLETLAIELEKVKAMSGHDEPEDWVGALTLALNDIHWREGSKKCLIWIADANAHGKRYCGFDNHNEEEAKMEPLVRQLAESHTYFVGINIMKHDTGCELTLSEMKTMYEHYGGPNFMIEVFKPLFNNNEPVDDNWPEGALNRFKNTINTTLSMSLNKLILT